MQTGCYLFNEQCDVETWLNRLAKSDTWQQEAWRDTETTYYDTFDWSLYRGEAVLVLSTADGNRELALYSHKGDLLAKSGRVGQPGFARDLPQGQLRRQLEPLVKMRRLLPRVTLRDRRRNLALLDGEGKTVLRLTVSVERLAVAPEGTQSPLRPCLRLLPVRGYHSPLERVGHVLGGDPSLRATQLNPLADALAALGRRPADYSSKLDLNLPPTLTAQQALRIILLRLLTVLKANLDGARDDIDSEFLHDLRVSVRRTRSALGQLKGLLPVSEVAPFRDGFSWLGAITGPTRDLDVYLLKFADYSRWLPDNHRKDLDPFLRFLQQRQAEEQAALSDHLRGARCRELLSRWQTLLERDRELDSAPTDSELPVKEVADRRIWKLFRRCVREGGAITPESPAEDLHELRKTCKKLRYLLEFFQSLYPADDMSALINALKVLQDNLGDFNDFQVQSKAMLAFGLRMAEMKKGPPATLLAMGMLAENLRRRQLETRREFEQCFATFQEDHNYRLFRQLFGKEDGKGASTS